MEKLGDKLLSWASILEDDTREQALMTARMPFIYPHVALMPDAHLGLGATVGSVVPTHRALMPAAVGVDIGCGMRAVLTHLRVNDLINRDLSELHGMISNAVPLSAGGYNRVVTETARPKLARLVADAHDNGCEPIAYAANWDLQLGSLGSGNHFIEISADEADRVWTFIHSGSRGIGNKIAQHHIKIAKHFCEVEKATLENPDLAFLVEGTPEFRRYVGDMTWAQHFARANRHEMTDRVLWCLETWLGRKVERLDTVECHHNYTTREWHYGREVWITRKGAINAHSLTRGLIPGSMGDASYVVTGKGNRESLYSAPHGAGRRYSRRKARELFTDELLRERMAGTGAAWGSEQAGAFVDEIPDAYKPIDQVMADAADLVRIDHTFRQLVNVKGV